MEILRDIIMSLRRENSQAKHFIPHGTLQASITSEHVRNVLKDISIEPQYLDEIVHNITQSKSIIFGVLVCIRHVKHILGFIGTDNYGHQPSQSDHKVPFTLENLRQILPTAVAQEFFEKQWEFVAPVFSSNALPRRLDRQTILPFINEEPLDQGGFGVVHKVTIHRAHQRFSGINQLTCVKKEFIPLVTNRADYEAELRNLSILNHLKHPNIIEALSAFTYFDKHNLIFPIKDGDLAKLLENERPVKFRSDATLVLAVCKLGSALEAVHDFAANTLDLRLIGCHHDLRPRNVLIDGETFVLADFGLSRFKSASQDSATQHRKGQGDYLAPECESLDGEFQKHTIGRSSDIWSFGCIIAELLTYMVRGPDGVEEFWKQRSHKPGQIRYHLFHHGPNQPSAMVDTWLNSLGLDLSTWGQKCLQLIKRMLSMQPDQRPKAREVATGLRLIALHSVTEPIDALYDELCSRVSGRSTSSQVFIQRARYKSWKEVCSIGGVEILGPSAEGFEFDLENSLQILGQLRTELQKVIEICREERLLLFLPLRHLNNRLMRLLPSNLLDSLQTQLEQNIVIETNDPGILEGAQQAFQDDAKESRVGVLARIKRMTLLASTHTSLRRRELELDPRTITYVSEMSDTDIAELKGSAERENRRVLIEWVHYESDLVDETEGVELLARVEAIADLLSYSNKRQEFRVLHCYRYFHEPSETRFGLVFDFPDSAPKQGEVMSLKQILDRVKHREQLPLLGDRFKLAYTLALSITEFHKAGWLHKNITPFNVVFFEHQAASDAASIAKPYLIGFNHSRPDDPFALTFGPVEGTEYLDYQHPEYIKHPQRYCAAFDYYSFGIVLMEIARWKALSSITQGWGGSPERLRERLMAEGLLNVGRTMGARFSGVIATCLGNTFMNTEVLRNESSEHKAMGHHLFDDLVVSKLAMCSA